jgi:hypothetical protein
MGSIFNSRRSFRRQENEGREKYPWQQNSLICAVNILKVSNDIICGSQPTLHLGTLRAAPFSGVMVEMKVRK